MKGKKRYLILVLLLIIFGIILYFTKDDRENTIKEKEEQINEYIEERERKAIKLTTITEIDREKYGDVVDNLGELILFKNDDTNYVFNNSGKELSSSKSDIRLQIYDSGLFYFLEDNLYDSEGKLVYKKPSDGSKILQLNDKYIILGYENENYEVVKEKLVDYDNKEITTFTSSIGFFNGILVYRKNDKIIVFDKEEKIFDKFDERENYNFLHLTSSSEEVYLSKNKGYITKDEYYKEKLNDSYYLEFGECLQIKSIVSDKLLSDECFINYKKINDNYYVFFDSSSTASVFRENKIDKLSEYEIGYFTDTLYYASKGKDDNNYYAFYENGDNVEFECASNITYAGNNIFACNDKIESYFIEKNKIRDDKYDQIICNHENDYCVVVKNNKYGLYYMGEKIIEPNYFKIEIIGNCITLDTGNKYYLLTEESGKKTLTKEKLNKIINEFDYDIDIDKVIEENNLDKYKDIINDNKDLFKKYANSVEKNNNLGIYKKYVYDYFKVIIDYKDYIDEDFFNKLNDLKIIEKNELLSEYTLGVFDGIMNEIQILDGYNNQSDIVLHELMHFIDFRLNSYQDNDILLDDKVISKKEYISLSLDEKRRVQIREEMLFDLNFISEGGAEIYSAEYFNHSLTKSYEYVCKLFYVFEYMLGTNNMKDVFFANKSFYRLVGQYLSEEKYDKFKDITNKITTVQDSCLEEDFQFVFDVLIDLYISKKSEQWYNDNEFCFLLYNLNREKLSYLKKSKYYDTYEKIHNLYEIEHDIYGQEIASMNNEEYIDVPKIIYENDNIYFLEYYRFGNEKEQKLVKYKYNAEDKNFEEIGRYDIK